MFKLKLQTFGHLWCEELTYWKRPWCWEGLKVGGEGDDRGWDDWMASLTQWTWVWVNSGSSWWTGRPGMVQSMGSQRVRHNWAELAECSSMLNDRLPLSPPCLVSPSTCFPLHFPLEQVLELPLCWSSCFPDPCFLVVVLFVSVTPFFC